MKVMVKEVGKPLAVVDTKEKYFGDFARSCLGKDITVERVYLDGMEFIMGVDEDGLMKSYVHAESYLPCSVHCWYGGFCTV